MILYVRRDNYYCVWLCPHDAEERALFLEAKAQWLYDASNKQKRDRNIPLVHDGRHKKTLENDLEKFKEEDLNFLAIYERTAEGNMHIAGFAEMLCDGPEASLKFIFTFHPYRKQGLSQILYKSCFLHLLEQTEHTSFHAMICKENKESIKAAKDAGLIYPYDDFDKKSPEAYLSFRRDFTDLRAQMRLEPLLSHSLEI